MLPFSSGKPKNKSKVQETLGLDSSQVHNTIQKFGNTTAATVPIGLKDALDNNKIQRGDHIIFAAFGSGFSWGSVLLKY